MPAAAEGVQQNAAGGGIVAADLPAVATGLNGNTAAGTDKTLKQLQIELQVCEGKNEMRTGANGGAWQDMRNEIQAVRAEMRAEVQVQALGTALQALDDKVDRNYAELRA